MTKRVKCENCKLSEQIIKWGHRTNQIGKKQRFFCKKCSYSFIIDDGFKKMKTPKEIVARAIHMYNDGLSLSKVSNHVLQHDNIKRSDVAVLKWVNKYSNLLKKT